MTGYRASRRATIPVDMVRMAVAALCCAGGVLGMALTRRGQRWFVGEDGIVEWSSATLYAIAAGLALVALRWRTIAAADRRPMMLIAGLGIACFLSEVSFGARIGHFAMPAMPGGGELDGGQDLAMLAKRAIQWAAPRRPAATFGLLAAIVSLVAFAAIRWRLPARLATAATRSPARRWIALAMATLAAAVLLDMFERPWTMAIEELAELFAAIALVIAAVSGSRRAGSIA